MEAIGMTWDIPVWWELEHFPNDTYTLTRVDGIKLGSYKTSMMIWGWMIIEGAEHFDEEYEDGIVIEAAAEYPNPVDFLFELDAHYPTEI